MSPERAQAVTMARYHYGYLCPVETQEGPACGLLKAFALGVRVSHGPCPASSRTLREALRSLLVCNGAALLETGHRPRRLPSGPPRLPERRVPPGRQVVASPGTPILGSVSTADSVALSAAMRACPEFHALPLHFAPSVYTSALGHVYIHTDEGRLMRPLLCMPLPPQFTTGDPNQGVAAVWRRATHT